MLNFRVSGNLQRQKGEFCLSLFSFGFHNLVPMHGDTIESNKRSCPFKSDMIWAYDLGVSNVVIANPSLCLRRPAPCVFRCIALSSATCMSACCVKCWSEHSPLLLEHLPSYVIYERVDQNKAKVWVGASTEPTRLTKEQNMMIHWSIRKSWNHPWQWNTEPANQQAIWQVRYTSVDCSLTFLLSLQIFHVKWNHDGCWV